jgi:hypothetical protein
MQCVEVLLLALRGAPERLLCDWLPGLHLLLLEQLLQVVLDPLDVSLEAALLTQLRLHLHLHLFTVCGLLMLHNTYKFNK